VAAAAGEITKAGAVSRRQAGRTSRRLRDTLSPRERTVNDD